MVWALMVERLGQDAASEVFDAPIVGVTPSTQAVEVAKAQWAGTHQFFAGVG